LEAQVVSSVITGSAIKVATSALPILGRRVMSRAQLRRIEDRASGVVVADAVDRFVEHLDGAQLERLREFVDSPEFSTLMMQTMVMSVGGMKEESIGLLRDQIRSSLRRLELFVEVDLVQATDVVVELLTSAAHALRATSGVSLNNEYAVAMAARVAASAARNSELMDRVRDQTEIVRVSTQVRSQVKAIHAKLHLPTVVVNRRVRWDQLYVPPSISIAPQLGQRVADVQVGKLPDALNQFMRLAVLGDPGAGKSTLAQKLAYDLATDKYEPLRGVVPLVLVARKYTEAVRLNQQSILDYLAASCLTAYATSIDRDQLEYLLLNGRAFVLIDGVDELGESVTRKYFIELLEAFAYLYPLVRILVTSRLVGYDQAPLDEELFPVARIEPFTREQVSKYARNWFKLEQMSELTDAFLHESERVSDIRNSPLVLTLLCTLYLAEQSIPENRPEIYARCADLLIEKWDSSRGIDLAPHLRPFLRRVVQRLAWKIFTDAKGRQALPREELVDFLATDVLADRYDSVDEARHASENFLDFCAGRAWVLTDTGSGTFEPWYGFTHKTFLEYFAANHLVKQEQAVSGVWDSIRLNLGDSRWDVVAELAVQIVDRDREDGADHLLSLLLDQCDLVGSPSIPAQHLDFAVRCLSSCVPSTTVVRRIVASSIRLALSQDVETRMSLTSPSLLDSAFTRLLATTLPGNAMRVVRATADALNTGLREPSTAEAAAVLWSAVDTFADVSVSEDLLDRRAGLHHDLVDRWVRLAEGWPTADDVDELGLSALYGAVRIGNVTQGFAAFRIIRAALAPVRRDVADVERKLEGLYESFTRLVIPRSKPPAYRFGGSGAEMLNWRQFYDYSPKAKGSLGLLMVGALRANFNIAVEAIDDNQLRNLLLAHNEAHREVDAIATLNAWRLPAEAHQQMVDWLVVAKIDRRS
jgi:hypothetical protein